MAKGSVNTSSLNILRSAPDGQVLAALKRGAEMDILSHWYQVRSGEVTGWANGEHIDTRENNASAGDAPPASGEGGQETAVVDISAWQGSAFVGESVHADVDFHQHLDTLNRLAETANVQVHVTSSFRVPGQQMYGMVVTPARRSNHLIGHAIDMNIIYNSQLFNSKAMLKSNWNSLPHPVTRFLRGIQDHPVLRWGGDFAKADTVHIDDGTSRNNPNLWMRKFQALRLS